jgi:hypothetical protein
MHVIRELFWISITNPNHLRNPANKVRVRDYLHTKLLNTLRDKVQIANLSRLLKKDTIGFTEANNLFLKFAKNFAQKTGEALKLAKGDRQFMDRATAENITVERQENGNGGQIDNATCQQAPRIANLNVLSYDANKLAVTTSVLTESDIHIGSPTFPASDFTAKQVATMKLAWAEDDEPVVVRARFFSC